MGWNKQRCQYEIKACYAVVALPAVETGKVAGIDLGEIHLAVSHDGQHTDIINGRLLRSKRRYQNKLKA